MILLLCLRYLSLSGGMVLWCCHGSRREVKSEGQLAFFFSESQVETLQTQPQESECIDAEAKDRKKIGRGCASQ